MITCCFENGGKAFLRHVTCNVIIIKEGRVLLGKRGTFQGRKIAEFGKWGLIGGYLGRDENLIQAIRREALEESGYQIKNIKLFRIKDNPDRPHEDKQNVDFCFLANPGKKIKDSDEEMVELCWFDLDRLPPKKQLAFDHADDLGLYKKYLKKKFKIPILGKSYFLKI
ncbi:MAG: NUDIX domain-containing protein [Microgenomates group bacterium]|nr:NUDIX domain-containing protein [Microgenomates group bacterium]